jgi:hypothetical protein
MLQKRTNILFDRNLWSVLTAKSQSEGASIGELVRRAVTKIYIDQSELDKRKDAIALIRTHRIRQTHINYKKLIEYGRTI